jgi:hypothetical protein
MPRCPSRSSTERGLAAAALALAAAASAGCGDDDACEPGSGDAPDAPITVAGGGDTRTFGGFVAAANNDCRTASPPDGVVSVTVFGGQLEPGSAFFTLCLPRPDLIGPGATFDLEDDVQPVPDDARVQVIDVQGAFDDGCTWSLAGALTGSITFEGFCGDGLDPAGFAITLDGGATVDRTCPTGPATQVDVTLTGRVAVAPQ